MESSERKRKKRLYDIILFWSIDDIINENLLKDKVKMIPTEFSSLRHYFESFQYPFIEEVRAQLSLKLVSLYESPFVEILIEADSRFAHEISFKWLSSAADHKGIYVRSVGDVILLSNVIVKDILELKEGSTHHCLAFIYEVAKGDIVFCKANLGAIDNKMKISGDGSRTFMAYFLMNITKMSCTWESLNEENDDNCNLIKKALCFESLVEKNCSCSTPRIEDVLDDKLVKKLNESQVDAIHSVICSIKCYHAFCIHEISGLPGTGKTEIVSIISLIILKLKCKAIVCSPTIFSVAEVASRFLNFVWQFHNNTSMAEVVLLQDNIGEKVDITGDLTDISMETRILLLKECFSLDHGWRHHITLMIYFLENFHLYMDDMLKQKTEKNSFVEFIRVRYDSIAFPLRDCIKMMCKNLPKSFFSAYETQKIVSLVNLIESFRSVVSNYISGCLEEMFLHLEEAKRGIRTSEGMLSDNLWRTRNQLLDMLCLLRDRLRLPTENQLETLILAQCHIIFCTTSSLSRLDSLGVRGPFDLLIMDNAVQIKESDSVVSLKLNGLRHLLLSGSDSELPPKVLSKVSESAGFGRSLFERLGSLRLPKRLLSMQYGMHPSINSFLSKKFYDGRLLNGPSVIDGSDKKCYLPERIYSSYAFLNVADGREVLSPDGENWINVVEAVVIAKILLKLFKAWEMSGGKIRIGVISPYEAQVQTIQEMLSGRITSNSDFSFWVRPSDAIESSEEDVIIISTVRCNDCGSIGLLSNRYLVEVSLTKARNFLWIVGNGPTLSTSHSIWQDLIFDAKERECFFQVCEDKQIAGAVLNIKRELDELDDMLKQESAIFCDTRWKIHFSDDFKQSFVTLKTVFSKQVVLGFLLRIASGWRPKRGCLYFLSEFVKQYIVHGLLYLVCTTDIVKDSQVLKVWDILPLVHTPMLLTKIAEMKSLFSDEYIKRCMMKKQEGDLVVPLTWKDCSDFIKYKDLQNSQGYPDSFRSRNSSNDLRVGERLLLMKFYALSSGIVKHLLTASVGKEIHLPFEVSDHESEIIQFQKTAFVLGRSGTGKTVVSMMKLVQREQQYFLALNGSVTESCSSLCYKGIKNYAVPEEGAGLRQLFVTVSPNLCLAVKNNITQLQRFAAGGEMIRDTNEVLMHEDGDYLSMFSDVPDTFIELPHCHFPLVISLKKFLLMLDATMSSSYFDRFHDLKVIVGNKRSYLSHAAQQLIQRKEVSYERFVSKYWSKMNYKLTRNLDPLLVFTQIISYIKGGSRLCNVSHDNIMNEKDYVMLYEKKNSTIRKDKRELIYKIFLDYQKKKRTHQDYDISDLVIDLHRRLRLNQYEGPLVDFIYIDEVQDFTMNQLSLFKYICVNAEEGFHFSGDTAQTISKGIDFRFQDIRSLFYREFLNESVRISDLFRLDHNFRTHSGILDLAQSVVELVYHFFPYSIDRLISEKSLVRGEVHVLLVSCSNEVLKTVCSVTETDGLSTFGAHQVILVRDEYAKHEVIDEIGDTALVLTILGCKGLELNDVLLYNFFDRSPLQGQWGVIYEFKGCQGPPGSSQKFPCFNVDKHSVLCSELKQLYVAITRTRQRFWIYDRTWDAKPLFDYWKKLGVLQLKNFDASFVNSVKVFCKPQEWNSRGQQLFNVGNYESAASCFKRSGDVYRENMARGACLQADGDRYLHLDNQLALKSLSKAAEIYEKIGKVESIVTCLMKMGEYKKAGNIYLEKFDNPRYEDAADCFSLASCWPDAAIYYAKTSCLLKCMSICQRGLLYEMGWGLINGISGNLSKDDKVNYLKSWITQSIKILPIKSMVECVKGFPEDGYNLLLENENYVEVALLQRVRGNTLCEASILERPKEYGNSLKLVVFCMAVHIFSSKRNDSPFELFEKQEKLVYKAKVLTGLVPSSIERYVSAEIGFLYDGIGTSLDLLAQIEVAQKFENVTVEFFASRQLLDAYLELPNDQFYDDPDDIFINGNQHLKRLFFQGHVSV